MKRPLFHGAFHFASSHGRAALCWLQDREGGGARGEGPPFANVQPGVWRRVRSVLDSLEVMMEVEDRRVWLAAGRPRYSRRASSLRKWKVVRGHWTLEKDLDPDPGLRSL